MPGYLQSQRIFLMCEPESVALENNNIDLLEWSIFASYELPQDTAQEENVC